MTVINENEDDLAETGNDGDPSDVEASSDDDDEVAVATVRVAAVARL